MTSEIIVKITSDDELGGTTPIVLLGPNGAGKTRHAVSMLGWNNANMIAALRNIALPPDVVMRSMVQATRELTNHLNRRRSVPWELSSEINELFSKLMAEDSSAATQFRDDYYGGASHPPERTKLMKLQEVWSRLFPGRHIDFKGYHPVVRSEYSSTSGEYPAQQMSDGERVALYLAGRVLDSDQNIIIVDEPEVHFHSRLGTRFWNEMEQMRHDCRFVYITHDLPFALSRRKAMFVIVMPNKIPQVVSLDSGLPKELSESLLAAASFSIHASRIIFCEGIEGPSIDQAIYSAWFIEPKTAVIPVETCENVIRCAQAFGDSEFVIGVQSVGLIDRDYWPERFLQSTKPNIHVLPVHEVENLLCVEDIFCAIVEHFGIGEAEAKAKYQEFIDTSKQKFTGSLLNKQIAERFRRRCEHEYRTALNSVSVTDDFSQLEMAHLHALDPARWGNPPATILSEEKHHLDSALQSGADVFNKYYPGKVFVREAAKALGLQFDSYVELICSAMRAREGDNLGKLGRKIEAALSRYLPPRTHGDDT